MRLRPARNGLLIALAATAAAAQAASPLEAVRVALPAQIVQGGRVATLLPREPVRPGDSVVTGARGRAAIQLAGIGQMTLGSNAELFVHSLEPPDAGRGALARVALVRGALRLDARAKQGLPPQDFRLNAGRLSMRVFGAEVWVELTRRGEDVCLLSGAVEIVGAGVQERLDTEGSCLLFGSGTRMHVRPDASETLARKLVRTAFAEDYVTLLNAEREEARAAEDSPPDPETPQAEGFMSSAIEDGPAELTALAPDPAPAPAAPPPPAPAGTWTVVVASVADRAAAEREAARLRAAGQAGAQVLAAERDGTTTWRVTVGALPGRDEARRIAAQLRENQWAGAWVTQQ